MRDYVIIHGPTDKQWAAIREHLIKEDPARGSVSHNIDPPPNLTIRGSLKGFDKEHL